MTIRIFNQQQAAEYLTESGVRIHESELSRMGKRGFGPRFQRLGHTKVFTQDDLDNWLKEQSDREKEEKPS